MTPKNYSSLQLNTKDKNIITSEIKYHHVQAFMKKIGMVSTKTSSR